MTGLRRLPAVTFRSAPPQPADVLPRMDIAAFVGFATRGPLHVPVPVEDVARFQAIFGPAPRLAWDPSAREWQTACLAGAVGDFFVQGGRRCWVVRVAGAHAATNRFPVAGLLQALPVGYAPVLARASSPGSWSDGLLVGASVQAQPLRVEIKGPLQPRHLTLLVGSLPGDEVRPGDTIQLDFGSQGELRAYLTASEVDWTQPEGGARRKQRIVGAAHWFERPAPGAYSGTVGRAGSDGPQMTGTLRLEGGAAWIETSVEELQVEPGDWLVFAQASYTPTFWLLAQQIESGLVRLRAAWREAGDLGAVLALQRAARVTMSLQARDDAQVNGRLDDLALSEPHPRYCGYIPDDAAIHRRPDGLPEPPARPPGAALQAEVERTRFPLAGPEDSAGVFIPLGLDVRPIWRGPQPQPGAALERDGLVPPGGEMDEHTWSDFVAELFLDPRLRLAAQSSLLAEAFDLRYMQHQELRGLHSMLPLEEASLLALPDAAHVGWRLVEAAATPLSKSPTATTEPAPCPGHDLFKPCEPSPAAKPAGPKLAPEALVAPGRRWELMSSYMSNGLLEVQRCAVELAAARADMLVVLGAPQHYRLADILLHRRELGRLLQTGRTTASYAALYYPWIDAREPGGGLRRSGPEGAACGVIAGRTLSRGAWVPPANQTIRSALALSRELGADEQAGLYERAINFLRPGPHGFVLGSASTLSEDPDLEPIGVRRLLILLRRLALREGQLYVFAPHSQAFRRRVARGFERVLAEMFTRGAFAGSDPAQAYRVVVDETLNTTYSVEQGRFVVELRVAPAQPLMFITVRLIQSGPETLTVQEV